MRFISSLGDFARAPFCLLLLATMIKICFFNPRDERTKEKKRARLRTTKTTTCPNCLSSSAFLSLPSVGFSSLSLSLFYARVRRFSCQNVFFCFFVSFVECFFCDLCLLTDSPRKWTYKSPVFLGENQEFSIFWPKIEPFSL